MHAPSFPFKHEPVPGCLEMMWCPTLPKKSVKISLLPDGMAPHVTYGHSRPPHKSVPCMMLCKLCLTMDMPICKRSEDIFFPASLCMFYKCHVTGISAVPGVSYVLNCAGGALQETAAKHSCDISPGQLLPDVHRAAGSFCIAEGLQPS